MDTRIWHRRRCSNCYAETVALSRQGIVICDECEIKGVTVEQVEQDIVAWKAALDREAASEARVSANATCRDYKCPCHRAPCAR